MLPLEPERVDVSDILEKGGQTICVLPLDSVESIRTFNIVRNYRLRVKVGVDCGGEKARVGFTIEGFVVLEGAKIYEKTASTLGLSKQKQGTEVMSKKEPSKDKATMVEESEPNQETSVTGIEHSSSDEEDDYKEDSEDSMLLGNDLLIKEEHSLALPGEDALLVMNNDGIFKA